MGCQKTPLIDALKKYLKQDMYPFHTPGHKQGRYFWPPLREMLIDSLAMDLTEVPGLDDLHRPEQAIADSQRQAAALFGARHTFYLVQGATLGVHAAILALGAPGKKFVLPRHAHRSAFAAMVLADLKPCYLKPQFDDRWGIPLGVQPGQLEEALPADGPVLLLAPSYEGVVPPLAKQIDVLRSRGRPVIVDEAHGGHFIFHDALPPAAVTLGADIVIHGSHKTLPTMTQTAMVHVSDDDTAERLGFFLDMLQTTSPSYVLLAALDGAQACLRRQAKEDWERTLILADELRQHIRNLKELDLLEEDYVREQGMWGLDRTRIVFRARSTDGYTLARLLRQERLEVEMSGWRHVVMILTPADNKDTVALIKHRLKKVVDGIDLERRNKGLLNDGLLKEMDIFGGFEVVLNPRQAVFSRRKKVPLRDAVGEVTAEAVIPYPPGIPLLWPGERFTRTIYEQVILLKKLGARFQGISDSSLRQISVISEGTKCL